MYNTMVCITCYLFVVAITNIGVPAPLAYFISGILYKENIVQLGSLLVLWSGVGMFYSFIIFFKSYYKE